MAGLDPDEDAAPSTNATDASSTPVHDAWSQWTSNPANNAALLQFGIAMLQPRAPGQSGIGAAANAIGEAGGAAGRVTAAQDAEDAAATKTADTESQIAARAATSKAAVTNADAYSALVGAKTSVPGGASAALKVQGDYRKWLAKPDDLTGMTSDPILGAIQKQYPEIKSKADLLANPSANAAAMRLFATSLATTDDGAPASGGPAPVATPSNPQTKTFYDSKGNPQSFNLVGGKWVPVTQ